MTSGNKQLSGAVLVAIACFLALGFVWPMADEVLALRAAQIEREDLLTTRAATAQRVEQFAAEYDQREADIRMFTAMVPAKQSVAELLSAAENIAVSSGVQLTGVGIASEATMEEGAQYAKVAVSLDGKSVYGSLIQFLSSVEQNIRLLDVESIDAGPEGGQGTVLTFIIKANAYFLK